jgi:hypothetical protein
VRTIEGVEEFAPLAGIYPAATEGLKTRGLADEPLGHAVLVFFERDRHGLAVHVGDYKKARLGYVHVETLDEDRGLDRRKRLRPLAPSFPDFRGRRDEVLAEEPGRVGVVVDAEHELVRLDVDARAATHHLVKRDRRLQILEEDDIARAGHIDTGGEEIDGGRDEVAPRRGAQVG